MPPSSHEQSVIRRSRTYGPEQFAGDYALSPSQKEAFRRYASLLEKWNRKIGLLSRRDRVAVWWRHFADSAQLLPCLKAWRPSALLDLGSGAGFPGLVLALLGQGPVFLCESRKRKAAFLAQVIRETGADAKVLNQPLESLAPDNLPAGPLVITARALAPLNRLLYLSQPFLRAKGSRACFFKGKTWPEELAEARKEYRFEMTPLASRTEAGAAILCCSNIKIR